MTSLLTMAGLASACTSVRSHDTITSTVRVHNETNPDVVLTDWRGNSFNAGEFRGCRNRREVHVRFTPDLPGFSFVRDVTIEGEIYQAYQWSSSSPLVVFSLYTTSSAGGRAQRAAVSVNRPTLLASRTGGTSIGDDNNLISVLGFRLISRGGPMTGGEMPALRGTSVLVEHPGAGSVQHQLAFTVQVPALPCELSDTSLALPDAAAADLLHTGQTTQTRALDVSLRCPSAGADVRLRLEDVNGSVARAGELTPTGDSTAAGVHLRVLRDGQPVQFGVPWEQGPRQAGINIIGLEAQYIRTDVPLQPGLVRGEARLTAEYP